MWFVINPLKDLLAHLQAVIRPSRTARRSDPARRTSLFRHRLDADHANPVNIRTICLKKAYSHCFSYFSCRAVIEFRVNRGGRGVMKTRGGGYMHVTPYLLAGGKLPRRLVAIGQL
jgi:hypothetical protein